MKKCPNCESMWEDTVLFCQKCGTSIPSEQVAPTSNTPQQPTAQQPSSLRRPRQQSATAPQATGTAPQATGTAPRATAVATPQATGTAPQASASATTAPRATTPQGTGTAPRATAPQATGTAPQATTPEGTGTAPQATAPATTAPRATAPQATGTAPQATAPATTAPRATTPQGTGTAPQATAPQATGTAPQVTATATTEEEQAQPRAQTEQQQKQREEQKQRTNEWLQNAGKKASELAGAGVEKAKQAASDGKTLVQEKQEAMQKNREESRSQSTYASSYESNGADGSGGGSYQSTSSRGQNFYVNPEETTLASIGESYVKNMVNGGKIQKAYGFITEHRFYFKGTNLDIKKGMKNTVEEGVVSLEDISFTRFIFTKNVGMLIAAMATWVVGILLAILAETGEFFLGSLVVSAIFLLKYWLSSKTYFLVCFAGGGFTFDASWYSIEEIRRFQSILHQAKDQLKVNQ